MMTFNEIATATLDQLTDELAAAGWDSCEDSIESARESVTRLLASVATAEQSYTSGRDYCESGSQRLSHMSKEWLAGYDAAAAEHRKYAEGIEAAQ